MLSAWDDAGQLFGRKRVASIGLRSLVWVFHKGTCTCFNASFTLQTQFGFITFPVEMEASKSCWARRTKLEIFLAICSLSLGFLATFFIVVANDKSSHKLFSHGNAWISRPKREISDEKLLTQNNIETKDTCSKICLTPGCVQAAASLLKNLNRDYDPCDNFYQLACGKFITENVIPDDKPSISVFSEVSDKVMQQLRRILDERTSPADPHITADTKNIYKSCLNEKKREELGVKPLLDVLDKLGGWPVLKGVDWDEKDFDWKENAYQMKEIGLNYNRLLNIAPGPNLKNTSQRILAVDQGQLGFHIDYLQEGLKNTFVKLYYDYQVDVAVLLGADRKFAEKELQQALLFSIELAKACKKTSERRNITALYNSMKLEEMEVKFPTIPWVEYVNRILPSSIRVNLTEDVVVYAPDYIEKLEKILESTPKRVQANFVIWLSVTSMARFLNDDLINLQQKYYQIFSGAKDRPPKWKECIQTTGNELRHGIGAIYIQRFFNRKSKIAAAEIINSITSQLVNTLEQVDWMDKETRKAALEKARAMQVNIGYPEELEDLKIVRQFYGTLNISVNHYFESILNVRKAVDEGNFSRLRVTYNKNAWYRRPNAAVVNAAYQPSENSIDIPAGILQTPFFSKERPNYLNYGSIGFVIGHEVIHGFDTIGRQFDKTGNLQNWWMKEAEDKFLEKAKCMADQYSAYFVDQAGRYVNGINTQSENIADNGGIKQAYRAYLQWESTHGEELSLPGLPFTPRQLFWLSAANTWCYKYRTEALLPSLDKDIHSPAMYRVIGAISNSEEFSRDFNCSRDTHMNPEMKCVVW